MQDNLLIGLLGKKGAGKSHTWKKLFGRTVRTGKNTRRLYLTKKKYVEVFLINGAPEERGIEVDKILHETKPRIVLSSIEYKPGLKKTFNFFIQNNYFMFIHWLTPGYKESTTAQLFYTQGALNHILPYKSLVGVRDANEKVEVRVQELKDYIYMWAKKRNLLFNED